MAYVDWQFKGIKVGGCNCDFGCPCEFNARPTYDDCKGFEAMKIEEGRFGDVSLDGLCYAALFWWPGPVHEGKGQAQGIIDVRANPEQRAALETILSGEEQSHMTPINFYGSTIVTEHETLYEPFEFEADVAARTARVAVPGVVDLSLEPICNPVTGKPHRALIVLPQGVEFKVAEMASTTLSAKGAANYDFSGRYGAIWNTTIGPEGILDESPVA
jgi:hypothetical protein